METVDRQQLLVLFTFIGVIGGAIYNVWRARSDSKNDSGRLGLDGWRELTNQLRGRLDDLHRNIRQAEAERDHARLWLRYHESRSAQCELILRSHGIDVPPPHIPPPPMEIPGA